MSKWHQNEDLAKDIAEYRHVRQNCKQSTREWMESIMRNKESEPFDGKMGMSIESGVGLTDAIEEARRTIDLADVIFADMNGGAVEAGYAIAKGKQLVTVGEVYSPIARAENDQIFAVDTWDEAGVYVHRFMRRQLSRPLAAFAEGNG
jgi:hypothetical protein